MERKGDKIIYSVEEQENFSVPDSEPIESALKTAAVFDEVAVKLENRAIEIGGSDTHIHLGSNDQRIQYMRLTQRSAELRRFSMAVLEATTEVGLD